MSLLTRVANAFRRSRVEREIDDELADHVASAVEQGRDRAEAERALGSTLRHREASADVKVAAWLDSLRADAVFGIRQLRRRPTATVAAIVSLALAIGAVTTAFRLIDAVLLRPLPVANPESLYVLAYTYTDDVKGRTEEGDSFSYPLFRRFKDAVKGQADLMVVSGSGRVDLTFAGDQETERAFRQRVSGTHFGILGLKPAAGRLFTAADDVTPGGHPVAVLTHDYWTRRFGRDPKIVGKTFRHETAIYEIVGVAQEGYLGTNTGAITDFFIPAMQNKRAIDAPNWGWMNIWIRPRPGASLDELQQRLQAVQSAFRREQTAEWGAGASQARKDDYINRPLILRSGSAGASYLQRQYRQPLRILGGLVLLVLLIACANVANLITAQAAARGKEMALRVSIGSGRGRLMQLMLVECLLLALAATLLGGLIAWKAAPFVVSIINPADDPLRLHMPADWRVLGFTAAVAAGVTMLFGLIPALRASSIQPSVALKGGDDPHSRRRLMNALVAVQVAFCFLVHFGAGLFVASFNRLAHQPTGFSVDGILTLETEVKDAAVGAAADRPQAEWHDILDRIRHTAGVEAAGVSSWALMSGNGWSSGVYFPGRKPDTVSPYFLAVTPGWLDTMGIRLTRGRDFRPGEMPARVDKVTKQPLEGPVIVNESFARKYFAPGVDPVGQSFETNDDSKKQVRHIVAGVVRDARYRDPREPILPTVYVPFGEDRWATIAVRVKPGIDPMALAQPLRQLVSATRAEYRVTNTVTQAELVNNQTLRERLLATLSLFFAVVALILAAVGLYGVMHYAVVQRRREIGIRIALGAPVSHVARQVSADMFLMLLAGSAVGMALGLASEQYVKTLLYEVKGADFTMLATPFLTLLAAALLAAAPPVMSAARTNPLTALRSE